MTRATHGGGVGGEVLGRSEAGLTTAVPAAALGIAEPTRPGMSLQYLRGGRPWRTYLVLYGLSLAALSTVWSGLAGIVLPNHIQELAFQTWFTGGDASANLQQLNDLKRSIAAGAATATADQTRLLGLLAQFDAARATATGVISAVSVIFVAAVQPMVGVLSDRTRSRFGRRAPWILFGAAAGSVTMAVVPFAPNLAILGVLWVAVSVFYNAAQGPLNTTVADRVPEEQRGGASSAGGLGSSLGGLAGAIAAAALYPLIGLAAYPVFAVVILVFFVMFVLILRDRSSEMLTVPQRGARKTLAGFIVPLKSADFRWVWVARVMLMFGYTVSSALDFFMLQSYIQPALSQSEATALTAVLALASFPATLIAITIAGRLSDKVGRRKPFVILASTLMAVAMLAPLVSPTLPALFVQTILTGFAFGIYLPVGEALFVQVLPDPENAAGRDLGVAALATNAGQALGPILAAQVVALTGSYTLVWPLAGALVAMAALAIIPVKGAR